MFEGVLRILAALDRRTRLRMGWLFVLMVVASALEMAGIGLVVPLFQVILRPDKVAGMPFLPQIAEWVGGPNVRFAALLGGAFFVFYVCKNLALILIRYIQIRFVFSAEADFTTRLVRFYLARPYVYHLRHNSSELVRNVTESSQSVFQNGVLPFLTIVMEAMILLGVIVTLLWFDPVASVLAAAVMGGGLALYHRILDPRLRTWGRRVHDLTADILQILGHGLNVIRETIIFDRSEHFTRAYAKLHKTKNRYRSFRKTVDLIPRSINEILTMGVVVMILGIAALTSGTIDDAITTVGVFGMAALRLMPSLNQISNAISGLRFGVAAIDVVTADLSLMRDLEDEESRRAGGDAAEFTFTREISVEGVSYAYEGSEEHALNGVDLKIGRGESIALVGSSGAGKTTLADILLGLLPPMEGRVAVDGVDIQENLRAWRAHLSFVPQSIYLLDDTVRRNVAFGLDESEIDEERVWSALRAAALESVVAALPEGLDTRLGERGERLSGGQRQRIGIARALYRDPDVLVFDEATSDLDNETEYEISRAIDRLAGNVTLVIIAHRLSTVRHCDRLAFMKAGRIVDIADFEALRARNPEFRRLVELSGTERPAEKTMAE